MQSFQQTLLFFEHVYLFVSIFVKSHLAIGLLYSDSLSYKRAVLTI